MNLSERKQDILIGISLLLLGAFAILVPAMHIHFFPQLGYKVIGMTAITIFGWEVLQEGRCYLLAKKKSNLLNRFSIRFLLLISFAAQFLEGDLFDKKVTAINSITMLAFAMAFLVSYAFRFIKRKQKV